MQKSLISFLLLVCGGLLLTCFVLFFIARVNQQALECSTYVREGIDLTGKGKNNCTDPDSIP